MELALIILLIAVPILVPEVSLRKITFNYFASHLTHDFFRGFITLLTPCKLAWLNIT